MHFHYYLPCRTPDCQGRIFLPAPIPDNGRPHQKPWPLDVPTENFLCPACSRAYVYKVEDLQLDPVRIPSGPCLCMNAAVFEFSFPCGTNRCTGRIEVHVVAPLRGTIDCQNEAKKIVAAQLLCTTCNHLADELNADPTSMRFVQDAKWAKVGLQNQIQPKA